VGIQQTRHLFNCQDELSSFAISFLAENRGLLSLLKENLIDLKKIVGADFDTNRINDSNPEDRVKRAAFRSLFSMDEPELSSVERIVIGKIATGLDLSSMAAATNLTRACPQNLI
jgi:hypothetical protein